MKKIILGLTLIALVSLNAEAQRPRSSYPYWNVSKDVQKHQFRNVLYVPAVLTTSNLRMAPKGIATIQEKPVSTRRTKIQTTGTPGWVVSKGVARMQYEKK